MSDDKKRWTSDKSYEIGNEDWQAKYDWLEDHVKRRIKSLMVAENFGDVHDEIDRLRSLVGLQHLEGGFEDGWTKADWKGVQ